MDTLPSHYTRQLALHQLLAQQKPSQAHKLVFNLVDEIEKEKRIEEAIDLLQEQSDVFEMAGAMEYTTSLLERSISFEASLQ